MRTTVQVILPPYCTSPRRADSSGNGRLLPRPRDTLQSNPTLGTLLWLISGTIVAINRPIGQR